MQQMIAVRWLIIMAGISAGICKIHHYKEMHGFHKKKHWKAYSYALLLCHPNPCFRNAKKVQTCSLNMRLWGARKKRNLPQITTHSSRGKICEEQDKQQLSKKIFLSKISLATYEIGVFWLNCSEPTHSFEVAYNHSFKLYEAWSDLVCRWCSGSPCMYDLFSRTKRDRREPWIKALATFVTNFGKRFRGRSW